MFRLFLLCSFEHYVVITFNQKRESVCVCARAWELCEHELYVQLLMEVKGFSPLPLDTFGVFFN